MIERWKMGQGEWKMGWRMENEKYEMRNGV